MWKRSGRTVEGSNSCPMENKQITTTDKVKDSRLELINYGVLLLVVPNIYREQYAL